MGFLLHFCSIKRSHEADPRKYRGLTSPKINAVDAKICVFNLRSISQAGRRGFDPRPPLHPFNTLEKLAEGCTPIYSIT
jgi:hypothetical protein